MVVRQRHKDVFFHIHGSDVIVKMIDIAFYSCYLGPDSSWSNQVFPPPSKDHRCYYFTNNVRTAELAKAFGWIVVWDYQPISTDEIQNAYNTKLLRCCPHLFEPLNKHAYLCYIDSKVWITNLNEVLSLANRLTDDMPIVLSGHQWSHTTVWGEFIEAIKQPRYAVHRDRYRRYIDTMLRLGYRDIPLRHSTGFKILKQCALARRIGESWYSHIGLSGIECQISWQFVCQDFPGAILDVPYKTCWNAL
jgi:hypothetical protein